MKFYVGNLNFRVTEDELRALFEPYGPIDDLIILHDRETGRSRGFGFITLADDEKAKQAYDELNQKDFEGRTLVMNEARPRTDRPQGQGYGGQQAAASQRPTGGGYTNQTYSNRNTASSPTPPTESADDDSASGGASGGYSGGYSRGGDH